MNRTARIRKADKGILEDLKSGRKSIETRAATRKFQSLAAGDTLTFVCGDERVTLRVRKVYRWKSVDAMARAISYKNVMPRAASLREVKAAYASWPRNEENIRKHGLLGFLMEGV